jgi:hypothetical protein
VEVRRRNQCDKKQELLAAYQLSQAAFLGELRTLNDRIGTLSLGEYEALRGSVESARMKSEETRLMLERHVTEHGC